MNNKLSELSKPVAYDYQIAGACIADGHNKNGKWVHWRNELSLECLPDWMIEEGRAKELKPLYSQEYVSALLAELEAKDKRIANLEFEQGGYGYSVLEDLNDKTKRIAVLSRLLAHNIERAEAAETKLATPVRLPSKNDDEFWFDGVFQVAKFDRAVERAISAAGFKCVGGE